MFVDDPFAQVVSCVFKVLESWDSPHARLYRQYLGVAEEWGTAVVVQRMVFGNLSRESGSGVTFTHNPLEPYSRQVRLFGDFAVRSQGEDLVGGLVFPLPVSEAQRLGSPTYRGTEHSLERDYPDVYGKLLEVAQELVGTHEYDPQEIEFTFESPAADDLYVLQKRAVVQGKARDSAYFDTSSPNYGPPVAVGMGVAGGAYSGRVAIDAGQIDQLLAESPTENIVLLRPDTVPEDIAIITRVNAILTARGGATSHAAVTAKRLGKTAVVDCRDLEVIERQGVARLAGSELHAGDWLSIDGRTGNIFAGRIPTLAASRHPARAPAADGVRVNQPDASLREGRASADRPDGRRRRGQRRPAGRGDRRGRARRRRPRRRLGALAARLPAARPAPAALVRGSRLGCMPRARRRARAGAAAAARPGRAQRGPGTAALQRRGAAGRRQRAPGVSQDAAAHLRRLRRGPLLRAGRRPAGALVGRRAARHLGLRGHLERPRLLAAPPLPLRPDRRSRGGRRHVRGQHGGLALQHRQAAAPRGR